MKSIHGEWLLWEDFGYLGMKLGWPRHCTKSPTAQDVFQLIPHHLCWGDQEIECSLCML